MFGKKKQEDESPNKQSNRIPDELMNELKTFSVLLMLSFVGNPLGLLPLLKEKYNLLLSRGLTREDILGASNKVILPIRARFRHEMGNLTTYIKEGRLPEDLRNNFGVELVSMIGFIAKDSDAPEIVKVLEGLITDMLEGHILQ